MPAQLTVKRTSPSASTAPATAPSTSASSVTSQRKATAASPSSAASSFARSSFRSAIATRAPRPTSARAVASPSPDAPPATSAPIPSILIAAEPMRTDTLAGPVRKVPRPLFLLLGAVAAFVVAWSLFVPPFQVPDEQAHFGYVQSLAERHKRPHGGGRNSPRHLSTEEETAAFHSRAFTIIQNPHEKPPWSAAAEARWRAAARGLHGGGRSNVTNLGTQAINPPLYYLYEAIPYELASGGDFFDRLYAMRLFSGLLMLVTAVAGWLVVGEFVGDARLLQLAGASVVALSPMTTFLSSAWNPDAAFDALIGLVIWLSVRTLLRGLAVTRAAA